MPTRIVGSSSRVADTSSRVAGLPTQVAGSLSRIDDSPTRVAGIPTRVAGTSSRVVDSLTRIDGSQTRVVGSRTGIDDSRTQVAGSLTRVVGSHRQLGQYNYSLAEFRGSLFVMPDLSEAPEDSSLTFRSYCRRPGRIALGSSCLMCQGPRLRSVACGTGEMRARGNMDNGHSPILRYFACIWICRHAGVRIAYGHIGIQAYGDMDVQAYRHTGIRTYGHTDIQAYGQRGQKPERSPAVSWKPA